MSAELSAVDKFRIDGAWHLAREVREHVRKILGHMESRVDEGGRESVEDLIRAFASTLETVGNRRGNHGGIEGDSTGVWRMIAIGLLGLNAGLLGWGLSNLVTLKEDVAVLKCQVNPISCPKVSGGSK